MEHQIDIRSDSRYPIDRKRIRSAVLKVLEKEGFESAVEVSVLVVGKRKAKALNVSYRDKDYVPNVLSFCLQEEIEGGSGFLYPENDVVYLGDVVLCYPVVVEQAAERHLLVDDWMEELVLHSMEHLLGRHHP